MALPRGRTAVAGAGGGSVATDAIFDAAGDLVQGTGSNTSARLALGTALQVLQVNSGATAVEWGAVTGTGSVVRATSPTLVTPALGTPSSGVVTNLTGTASININGTVGATTPAAGTFTTLVAGSTTSLLLGTAGSAVGNIGFRNATGGTITVAPVTGALGAVTLSLPAATDTLVGKATTDTLTNKTTTDLVMNGTPSGTAMASAATASKLVLRDANANASSNSHLDGYTTTATAAGTTTLTVASTRLQFFTGSTTQTVTLPVTSTLVLGQQFIIKNLSSGAVTVNSSGGNAVATVAANTQSVVTCILTSGTTAASWDATASGATGGSGTVTATGGSLTSNAVVLGAGTTDTKVSTGITTDGASQINVGVASTTLGKVKFFGSTSGDATIQTAAVAGTSTVVTLPNASSTLPIFGQQITFTGPTAARSIALPDAAFTVARTDAAQTFTGTQTFGAVVGTTSPRAIPS